MIYKICRIVEVLPSDDGLVRTVKICYLNPPSRKQKFITVDVRRLSLIYSTKGENSATDHTNEGSSASSKSTNPKGSSVGNKKGKPGSPAGLHSSVVVVL